MAKVTTKKPKPPQSTRGLAKTAKPWTPTQDELQQIHDQAALGLAPAKIALALGVSLKQLESAAQEHLDKGRLKGEVNVRRQLAALAGQGDARAALQLAAEFAGQREELATSAELMSWLCCSANTLSEMAGAGIVEPAGKNLWRLKQTVQRVVTHLRATAAKRNTPADVMSPAQRLQHERAEAVAMENAQRRGLLIEAHVYESHVAAVLKTVAQAYDVIPDTLEAECGLTAAQVAAVQRVLDQSRAALADAVSGR